eukprot:CCRYP_003104-RA/>CCRYP_003104-RA protein AED:0.41 eAED:0.41 QI:0/0/0/1/0/0.5/2/0/120
MCLNDIQLTINKKYVDSDTCAADIAHLIAAGVEVDVKQPAPENTVPDNTSPTQKWQLPTTCACKADDNIKVIARWKKFSWPTILSMDVLAIFRMCMPKEYMREHMIPSMNQHLDCKITLS